MNKNIAIIAAAVLVVGVVAFAGGAVVGPGVLGGLGMRTATTTLGTPGGPGGQIARLSEEDRARMQGMSDEERRAFMQERFGAGAPGGAAGAAGRMRRGGVIEGELLDVSSDTVSVKTNTGGSQTVYIDENTIVAYASGTEQNELSKGDNVWMSSEAEADGVISATALIVR